MERIVCLIIGYVLGNFSTAYIYGRMNGIDIREYGSGNAGTTNALRVLGTKAGLIVLAGDIIKCGLAILCARLLYAQSHPDLIYILMLYAVTGAILGHNFPVVLGFRGGKGIACTAGLVLFYHPYLIPVGVLLFFGCFLTTHYVSLGSLLVYVGFMIEMIVLGKTGCLGALTGPQYAEILILSAFLTVMAFVRHKENIKRLLSGTERKTYLTKKNKQ